MCTRTLSELRRLGPGLFAFILRLQTLGPWLRALRRPATTWCYAAVTLAVLMLAACSRAPNPAPALPAPSPTEAPLTPAPGQSQEVQAQFSLIEQQVIALRGLEPRSLIEKHLISREAAERYLTAEIERERADLEVRAEVYKLLGLIPAGADLLSLQRELLSSQVLGFYDLGSKRLYVLAEGGSVGGRQELALAHEIDHALQDQHFDLKRLYDEARGDWDRRQALLALVEGEATVFTAYYAAHYPLQARMEAVGGTQIQDLGRFPFALQQEVLFPYVSGANFITSLLLMADWPAVNAAFQRPPATTEQILHPEKYQREERAQPVALPDLTARLGPAWRLLGSSTFGEFNLRTYLRLKLDRDVVAAAAHGWGGDRWALYGNGAGERLFHLALVWDTEEDRDQFFAAYRDWLQRSDGPVQILDANRLRWDGPGRHIALEQRPTVTELIIATSATTLEQVLGVH